MMQKPQAGSGSSGRSQLPTPLPDAAPSNWVDRHAPASWRPWLKLARLDRPTGIPLLMLPGWQGIALAAAQGGEAPDPRLLALFAAGAGLMRTAGCAFNDIVERDLDARGARTAARPMASGQIGQAILAEASLSYLGLGVQEPVAAWGLMLQGGAEEYASTAPWIAIFPGLAIMLTVFGINLFGDALRDVLDPKMCER